MRTLKQMVERVKKHVRAAENLTWSSDEYEDALVEAAKVMWRQMATMACGRMLRTTTESSALASTGIVSLPTDCLCVEEVIADGRHLEYCKPCDESGLPYSLPFSMAYDMAGWTDDGLDRTIRVVGVKEGAGIVIQYIREPVFPFEDDGTLRDPGHTGTDVYPTVPELADTAVEYLAAALMLGEEVKDETPIGYCGSQYSSYLSIINNSLAVKPARRYVRRVSGR